MNCQGLSKNTARERMGGREGGGEGRREGEAAVRGRGKGSMIQEFRTAMTVGRREGRGGEGGGV